MLKIYRHLLDEIDVARQDLAKYPDPGDAIENAGNRDWYSGKLDDAYAAVEECAERLEKADAKAREGVANVKDRDRAHNEALAARQAEANKVDTGVGETVFEDSGATGPGGKSGQTASREKRNKE